MIPPPAFRLGLGSMPRIFMASAISLDWTNRYKERFDRMPDYHASGAYAATQILEQAIKATKSLDNTKLRDYIRDNSFDTVIAQGLSFDERGAPSYSMVTLQWQDGDLKVVWPLTAQTAKPRAYAP